jgi:PIN domain nuclease of toxin-antitoxin system
MNYLLDTHTLLWYFQNKNLNINVANILENTDNNLYISIAGLWEIVIKLNINKLRLECSFEEFSNFIKQVNIEVLLIGLFDLETYLSLPLYHRDPFDRILVAQAINYSLILISRDVAFDNYSIQRLW